MVCLLALFSVYRIEAQNSAKTASINGYWELTAEFPDFEINTIVCFKTSADSQMVEGIVLGPTSGRESSFIGKISSDQVSLKAPGPFGEMQVNLTLSENTLLGTWAAGQLKGRVKGNRIASRKPEPNYYPKYLNTICQLVRESFYDPRLNGIDIDALKAKYAARLPEVNDDADFVKLIRAMLGEFNVSHIDFYLVPESLPLKEKTPLVSWRKLSSQTRYLKIRHFDPRSSDQKERYYQLLEKAMEEIGDSSSLIVDLRGNRGGNLAVVFNTFSYFLQPGLDLCYASVQAGAGKMSAISYKTNNDLSRLPVIETTNPSVIGEIVRRKAAVIRLGPEQKKRYQGKVVLLIDERCYSGCEIFSAILQEKGRATLIGQSTKGEALGSLTNGLVKNLVVTKKDTGWRLEIPAIDFRTIEGKSIEGIGVRPNMEITGRDQTDAALAEALRYLERGSASQK